MMSVIQRPGWYTSDGLPFADRKEAEAHEYRLSRAAAIEEFLTDGKALEYTDRGKTSAKRIIGDFLDFLHRKEAPMPWLDESDEPALVHTVIHSRETG